MTHVPIDGRMWCNEQGDHRWDSTCPHVDNADAHPRLCCGHSDLMTSQPPRTGSTATCPTRPTGQEWREPCGRPMPCPVHLAASPSVTEPETPAAPRTGCDIDGSETLTDWALRLANERVSGIIEPHELAHARHRRDELAAALAAGPAEAQAGAGIDVLHIIRERLADYRSCSKEDDCEIRAEGIERALEDVEYERARLASLPTEPEATE